MSRATRSAIGAAIALMGVGLLLPDGRERLTATTLGTHPHGYRAVFELLLELGFPVSRSFDPPERIAAGSAVWWIEPDALCIGEGETPLWELGGFLEQGGTALVFLPRDCARLGALEIPARSACRSACEGSEAEQEEPTTREETEEHADPDLFERWLAGEFTLTELPGERQLLTGGPGAGLRELDAPLLRRFEESDGFEVRARLDGAPFILEKALGAGRLVLLADAGFLSNGYLDRGDAAPLAVDLASHYGVTLLDEHAHGLHREERILFYLARSAAMPVFVGLALLGLLALWRGSSLPRRSVERAEPAAPAMDRFVASLASLYARSRDKPRVAERYRELTLARLRRQLGLAAETPARVIIERLRRDPRLSPSLLRALTDPETPHSEPALRAQARRLDALVKEAVR